MRAALEPPEEGVLIDGVYVLRPGAWKPPAIVAPDVRREAADALAALRSGTAPVSHDDAKRWVAHLANRCNGSQLPPETKLMGAVSDILNNGYPSALFTDPAVFDRVARKFRFWPGWAELSEALDAERTRLRDAWGRLSVLAKGGAPAPQRRRPQPEDDRDAGPRVMSETTEKLMADFWARNGGKPAQRNMGAPAVMNRGEG
ncbi:hypothetical protein Sp245p_26095 (plasmid) [Azospirillum baldaniorum]|uniref:Uncharacterized protein n=1 Tax=Azospirillum baldaniorum TaxID=1064539 RepID=A0A9P1JZU1_9PROT|nr:hypothetical protein Sp245p_26095 [Azospirillum baldaniorum]TWA77995.1 hypothetical protein FBZ85_106155 [Azospirillum brasilense]CCD02904.1 protein of unknown function [Azospirillum baldaniorum]